MAPKTPGRPWLIEAVSMFPLVDYDPDAEPSEDWYTVASFESEDEAKQAYHEARTSLAVARIRMREVT